MKIFLPSMRNSRKWPFAGMAPGFKVVLYSLQTCNKEIIPDFQLKPNNGYGKGGSAQLHPLLEDGNDWHKQVPCRCNAFECTVLQVRDSNLGPQVGLIGGFSKDTMVSQTQADEHSLYCGIPKFPGLQTKLL